MRILFSVLFLASLLAGCAGLQPQASQTPEEYRMPTDVAQPTELTQAVEAEIESRIPPADCPVTSKGTFAFQPPQPFPPSAPWEGIFWFGSSNLWTALQNNGVWYGLPLNPDGYTQKIMWWSDLYSLPNEPEPELVVTGRRLDADAPLLRFYGATNAMADDIREAILTGVEFPSLGCWEVRGEYKKAELTFVVWIAP